MTLRRGYGQGTNLINKEEAVEATRADPLARVVPAPRWIAASHQDLAGLRAPLRAPIDSAFLTKKNAFSAAVASLGTSSNA